MLIDSRLKLSFLKHNVTFTVDIRNNIYSYIKYEPEVVVV